MMNMPNNNNTTSDINNNNNTNISNNSSGCIYDEFGRTPDKKQICGIGLPSAGADSGNGYQKCVFENKCPHCGKAALRWGWHWEENGQTAFSGEGGNAEGHFFCHQDDGGCDADYSAQGNEHINGSSYKMTMISGPTPSTKEEAQQLIEGKLPCNGSSGVSSTNSSGGNASLIEDKTFYGLIKQMMGATDSLFIIANNMAYLLSFKDIYEYRNQYDEYIPKIDPQDVIENTMVKNYAVEGYYNAVEVEYANGIIKYQNDVLVKQYGENPFYYYFPEDDEETAKAKADALLAAHIRDYSSQIQMSIFFNENITVGSWVKVKKSITNITGKTRKERQQEEIQKKSNNKISTKHKGINITNLTEKTIVNDNVAKKIRSITDEEGNIFDIEIEDNEYELFFVQGFTCRWDKNNALIMDIQLKYGPDTPEDPINATIGTATVDTANNANIGGQAADINAFVQSCLGNSISQDKATAEKLYTCLCSYVVYHYYSCSDYSTASECYQNAAGGGTHDKGINCADTSRLVAACYKAAGFQAEVVWGPGHFWNEVKVESETITVDVSSGRTGQHCTRAFGTKLSCGGSFPQKHEGDNPHC